MDDRVEKTKEGEEEEDEEEDKEEGEVEVGEKEEGEALQVTGAVFIIGISAVCGT